MKIIVLMAIGLLTLTGCQTNGGNMKNSISFEMDNQYWPNHGIVYKNNWPECGNLTLTPDAIKKQKYITSYSSCKVEPEGYVPQQIIIEYAPWLTYEEQIKKGYGVPEELRYASGENAEQKRQAIMVAQQNGIAKLPSSVWKRIVLTPTQEVEKYKGQVPEGKGDRRRGKRIHYTISLQPDGSYSIKTELNWVDKYLRYWN
ncbi:hypothetical protein HWI77_10175 [Acinetobacter venetianus]|uniref:Lipoprotein n=1 Tax=Acinetobacter venetianus (strain ATCC 31012 / DSM 23050 / BCRC 14357 / CCUG 45561 / CIP 110063 / KCTC 2702 / LMG 19082 / RAG-1) TaxID=1191460 RepID=N8ZYC7_ACIVR|nr:hypothetical protein [Acinetobacter venetianus]ENV36798.1 hypothetical protein F959_02349 [Acinetobacter venetianus RAG-1 = CIP 110063]KXZ63838.1 hypothetical protein AVENLUH7437_02376 [Acinetobacter venetianus]QNH50114.1 hypothetical protein HWI77_10175 [Acinetobacter venetianus]